MGTQVTASHEVGCRSRLSRDSSPGKRSASASTWSCSGWRRCGRSASLYSKSGWVGSPSACCARSTEPRAAARRRAVGLPPLHTSSPSSLSDAVEAVEAVEQVEALLAQLPATLAAREPAPPQQLSSSLQSAEGPPEPASASLPSDASPAQLGAATAPPAPAASPPIRRVWSAPNSCRPER